MKSARNDEKVYGLLGMLRKHMVKCHQCQHATSASIFGDMCADGKALTVRAAGEFNDLIEMKRDAYSHGEGIVYACPDLASHGAAYAMVAQPMHVTGAQGGLF